MEALQTSTFWFYFPPTPFSYLRVGTRSRRLGLTLSQDSSLSHTTRPILGGRDVDSSWPCCPARLPAPPVSSPAVSVPEAFRVWSGWLWLCAGQRGGGHLWLAILPWGLFPTVLVLSTPREARSWCWVCRLSPRWPGGTLCSQRMPSTVRSWPAFCF